MTPEEEVRDPYLLEFLNLKAEYSESDLEEAIIRHIEAFLLELGDDFCFVGRQRRLRIDNVWYTVDLMFFHRNLRALLLLDLKLGAFTHADAGQMNLYLNYAREHWTRPGENPPVGLILCAEKGHDVARYALGGLANKVLASTYRTVAAGGVGASGGDGPHPADAGRQRSAEGGRRTRSVKRRTVTSYSCKDFPLGLHGCGPPMCRTHTMSGRRLPIAPNFRRGSQGAVTDAAAWAAGNSRRRPPHKASTMLAIFDAG